MHPEDVLAPVYREYGTQLWRGVTMTEILHLLGRRRARQRFRRCRAHDFAWCVPIATQTLHAAGAAMAFKIRGEPRCALAYIGDGGTSEGAFYEALNLAGARALPVVFVIVNNGWAISVPVRRRPPPRPWRKRRSPRESPAYRSTAMTCSRCAQVVGEALEAARRGAGPC